MTPNDRFKKSTSSFVTSLYEAYVRADSGNRRRIEQAFPHLLDLDVTNPDDDAYYISLDDLNAAVTIDRFHDEVQINVTAKNLRTLTQIKTAKQFAEYHLGKPYPYQQAFMDNLGEDVVIDKSRDSHWPLPVETLAPFPKRVEGDNAFPVKDWAVSMGSSYQDRKRLHQSMSKDVHPVDAIVDVMKSEALDVNKEAVDAARAVCDEPVDFSKTAAGCADRFSGPANFGGYPEPMIQLKLLEKYMRHVREAEGTDFIGRLNDPCVDIRFLPDEVEVLEAVHATIEASLWKSDT